MPTIRVMTPFDVLLYVFIAFVVLYGTEAVLKFFAKFSKGK